MRAKYGIVKSTDGPTSMQLDEFDLAEKKSSGDGHPLCAACGKRLTQFLIMPETERAGAPVRFEICIRCQTEVVETIRQRGYRTDSSTLH
jgi:hypothetical protein